MKRFSILGAAAALFLFAGVALAWTPTGSGVCNTDTGVVTYTVTLHLDGQEPGSYSIDGVSKGAYVNGQVITFENTGAAIVVKEFQGENTITQTFGPIECPQPTPTPSPSPSPSPSPTPSASPSPSPVVTPVPSAPVPSAPVPTPPATSTQVATPAGNVDSTLLFAGMLVIGFAVFAFVILRPRSR